MRVFRIFLSLTLMFLLSVSTQLRSQSLDRIGAADSFVEALFRGDLKTVQSISSSTLLASLDTSKLHAVAKQVTGSLGSLTFKWLKGTQEANNHLATFWHTHFERDSVMLQVVVDASAKVAGVWIRAIQSPYKFPLPPYADTALYTEKKVFFGTNRFKLPGILTVPNGEGTFPIIVMVAGSGPNDRDETVKGNKPFRDIAHGLAMQGIATFRYDKRTRIYPDSMDLENDSVEEEVLIDAVEALNTMAARPECDKERMYLLGHSLGGQLAPEIASRSSLVRGVIMLAAPARDLVTVSIDQFEFFRSKADPSSTEEIQQLKDAIIQGKRVLSGVAAPKERFANVPASYYYKLNEYNQIETAKKLKVPMFFAQGDKDYQVTMKDWNLWQASLGDKKDITFKVYKDCYHLFIQTSEPMGRSNYDKEGHVTRELIDDIANWVKQH